MILLLFPLLQDLEIPQNPSLEETLQDQIQEAIFEIQQGFGLVNKHLREAQLAADNKEPLPLIEKLNVAHQNTKALVSDIEKLLTLLPETESQGQEGNEKQSNPSNARPENESPSNRPEGNDPGQDQAREIPPPTPQKTPLFLIPTDGASWGSLPPRLQSTLQNATIEDMPVRYRSWLKGFHQNRD